VGTFSASTRSTAVVPAERSTIWTALVDPKLLPQLTPLLRSIDADGDYWRWHLMRISALGVGISPVFTERMRFDPERRIEFTHEPPQGSREYAGVEGTYELTDNSDGTLLAVELTIRVELPLPKLSALAVQRVMKATMARTGDRFSANLLRHLGLS
jgi:carbon monoxide dehydrogenase subunit G